MSLASAACPDLAATVQIAETKVIEFELDEAEVALTTVSEALECSWLTPDLAGRLWLAEGAAAKLGDQGEDFETPWQAARRVAPELWNDDYGPKLRAAYDEVSPATGSGSIVIPAVERWKVRLDGVPVDSLEVVPVGLHVVQLGTGDAPAYGRTIFVEAGAEVRLDIEPPPEPVAPPPQEPDPPREFAEDPLVKPPRVALHLGAGAGYYSRFGASAWGMLRPAVQIRLVGPISIVAGADLGWSAQEGVGLLFLPVVHGGVGIAIDKRQRLRAAALMLAAPQKQGVTLGAGIGVTMLLIGSPKLGLELDARGGFHGGLYLSGGPGLHVGF